ncbi:gamma-soluble NSF attachment protein-like [Lineus longissimus]|uniref:gamma-soluble NSF attachment protein-like n=1 Tax=Lineus longissimus TaxID=88925 RepID=UPI002B4D7918
MYTLANRGLWHGAYSRKRGASNRTLFTMSKMAVNDRRQQEAYEHIKAAEKCMKTGLFKWRPDFDGAAAEYSKAAVCFKNVKLTDKAIDAYMKAAEMQRENKSYFHAGKSLEAAAIIYKDMKNMDKAAELFDQAGTLYHESGTPDTAGLAMEKIAKILEQSHPDRAIYFYSRAADIAELEDKHRQAAESVGKIARLHLRLRRYDEALEALKKEISLMAESENYPQTHKLVVAMVMVHLIRSDFVAADKVFNSAATYPGFEDSDEAYATRELLDAFDNEDPETMTEILNKPLFKYMENEFTKLARALRIPSGGNVHLGAGPGAKVVTTPDDEDDECDLK